MMANDSLYSVKISEIWSYFKSQDILFWLINLYLFMEYVRPQALYPVLDVIPLAKIILILTLIVLLLKKYPLVKNHSNVFIGMFTLAVFLSSIFAMSPTVSFQNIYDYLAWVIIYYLVTIIVNTKERFFVFVLCFLIYSFKMSQFSFKNWVLSGFAFSNWGTGGGPGWFHNSGEFGIQMCVFLPIAFYFFYSLRSYWPRWKQYLFSLFPLTALTGTISCSSRGALVGAGAVLLWMLLKSQHKLKGLIVVTLVAALVWTFVPSEQKARFDSAGEDRTSVQRIERWEKGLKMTELYPLLGVGYANWVVADERIFGGNGALSHNILIQCMSELGYVGLAAFLLMIFSALLNNYQTRKLVSRAGSGDRFTFYMAHGLDGALIGYLVSGLFVTVMYYPYFWINLSLTVVLNNVAKKNNNNIELNL